MILIVWLLGKWVKIAVLGVKGGFGGFCLYVGRGTGKGNFLGKCLQVGNAYFGYLRNG